MSWQLFLILALYLACGILVQRKIISNIHFGKKLKIVHSILLWTIPFVWAILLFFSIRKRDKLEIMLQDKEKTIRENWAQPLGRSNWTSMN